VGGTGFEPVAPGL